jgi:hypothetical protein
MKNFLLYDFEFCTISLLVMLKYKDFDTGGKWRKSSIFKFNYFVWTPLGSRVNIYVTVPPKLGIGGMRIENEPRH